MTEPVRMVDHWTPPPAPAPVHVATLERTVKVRYLKYYSNYFFGLTAFNLLWHLTACTIGKGIKVRVNTQLWVSEVRVGVCSWHAIIDQLPFTPTHAG